MAADFVPGPDLPTGLPSKSEKPEVSTKGLKEYHPSGKEGYGRFMQIVRGATFGFYFMTCCLVYVPTTYSSAVAQPNMAVYRRF